MLKFLYQIFLLLTEVDVQVRHMCVMMSKSDASN